MILIVCILKLTFFVWKGKVYDVVHVVFWMWLTHRGSVLYKDQEVGQSNTQLCQKYPSDFSTFFLLLWCVGILSPDDTLFITMDSNSSDVHIMGLFVPDMGKIPTDSSTAKRLSFQSEVGLFPDYWNECISNYFFKNHYMYRVSIAKNILMFT